MTTYEEAKRKSEKKVLEKQGGIVFPRSLLTVRDYFAAKALVGLLSHPKCQSGSDMFAREAYALADAMLNERKESR